MTEMRYRKALTITNMQIIITKIRFWSSQGGKIRCDMLIGTSIRKPINITDWGEVALHQIGSRLLAITLLLELRTVGSGMAKILTQLASQILPPIALQIALPWASSTVTEGGALEVALIRFGASKPVASDARLVETPATIETTPTMARSAKGLALCNKGRRWSAGCGQQRSMYGSWRFVKKFMREEMTVKSCIR